MRVVKTRKEHKCSYCGGVIKKDEFATFGKGRAGRFDKNAKQIGIHYYSVYVHLDIKDCRKNGAE